MNKCPELQNNPEITNQSVCVRDTEEESVCGKKSNYHCHRAIRRNGAENMFGKR